MKVFLVGHSGPEHQWVEGVYKNKEDALKVFEKIRLDLLANAKHMMEWSKEDAQEHLKKGTWFDGKPFDDGNISYFKELANHGSEMYKEIIERLSEPDPDKIDNYPQETPFIKEEELK